MRYAFFLTLATTLLATLMLFMKRTPTAVGATTPAATTQPSDPKNLKQATFAAGCFWGVESAFRHVPGVVATSVGYTGGHTDHPTYREVCTDSTGHAEAVLVTYDITKVSYFELLDAFWTAHDPTTLNSQGPDFGSQYRSAIFYHDAEQEKEARASLKEVDDSHIFHDKIVTEIVPAGKFTDAEEYHQEYFAKQGAEGTCHTGIAVVHTKLAAAAAAERAAATAAK